MTKPAALTPKQVSMTALTPSLISPSCLGEGEEAATKDGDALAAMAAVEQCSAAMYRHAEALVGKRTGGSPHGYSPLGGSSMEGLDAMDALPAFP